MDDDTVSKGVFAGDPAAPTVVDAWLEPLGDPACGADLEYDDDFREMEKAAVGKVGTQFAGDADAVPPDWRTVGRLAAAMFDRTRDLRVAIYWARAQLRLEGVSTLPEGLRLVGGLLERFWDGLYPVPDDGDAYARVNALNDMCSQAGMLGDLREAFIISNRAIGELRGRDVEIALGALEPRADESAASKSQIEEMLRAAVADEPALRSVPQVAVERVKQIQELMREQVGYGNAPDMKPLVGVLSGIAGVMPAEETPADAEEEATDADDGAVDESGAPAARKSRAGLSGAIDTRADALRAIDMVCAFLERTEPTNPAQLLLRRARRLVNKNFLELVRELAPESLAEVARVMGVSAEEYSTDSATE